MRRITCLSLFLLCLVHSAMAQQAYAVLSNNGQTVTFFYDNLKDSRSGVVAIEANAYKSATTAVFDASFANYRPTSTEEWFYNCAYLTTIDGIENLNTENVGNMQFMFSGCSALTNLDLSSFNTSKVTNMNGMFSGCEALTDLDVSYFDTANVKDMRFMFSNCKALTNLDVSNFNTANVTDMQYMFRRCNALTSLDVSNFSTINVTNMEYMFFACRALTSLDVSKFKTAKVTSMDNMFNSCIALTSLDVSHFKTANVTSMSSMFSGCRTLTSLDLSSFNTSKVTNMSSMFSDCNALTNLDLSSFNTPKVTDMSRMFYHCDALCYIDADESKWSTANVTDGSNMFDACNNLMGGNGTLYGLNHSHTDHEYARIDKEGQPGYLSVAGSSRPLRPYTVLSDNEQTVTFYYDAQIADRGGNHIFDGEYPFSSRTVTTAIFDASFANFRPTTTVIWFASCLNLTSINGLENLNTESVTNMANMFSNCENLTCLDLSSIKTSNVTKTDYMFSNCYLLKTIYVSAENWNTDKVTSAAGMFANCLSLVGGRGTEYSHQHMGVDYAHIDGGVSNPGYLTDINGKSELEPIETEIVVNTNELNEQDLTDNIVGEIYYNLGSDGYDSTDGSVIIGQTTNMGQIGDGTPGSSDIVNNFTGLILKVAAGKGTITVNVKTTGNAQLVVQVGNQTPMIATKTEQGDVVVSYDVTEDTYVYIYAIIGSSTSRSIRVPSADVVKIYGITVTPGATGIDAIHRSQSIVHDYYTPDGRKLEGVPAKKGLYIVNGRKVAIK